MPKWYLILAASILFFVLAYLLLKKARSDRHRQLFDVMSNRSKDLVIYARDHLSFNIDFKSGEFCLPILFLNRYDAWIAGLLVGSLLKRYPCVITRSLNDLAQTLSYMDLRYQEEFMAKLKEAGFDSRQVMAFLTSHNEIREQELRLMLSEHNNWDVN